MVVPLTSCPPQGLPTPWPSLVPLLGRLMFSGFPRLKTKTEPVSPFFGFGPQLDLGAAAGAA